MFFKNRIEIQLCNLIKIVHMDKTNDFNLLFCQFCCNDPQTFLKAAQLAESFCDAIDLNLGCPQVIAKRGHYGAYLQDEWDLIAEMGKLR